MLLHLARAIISSGVGGEVVFPLGVKVLPNNGRGHQFLVVQHDITVRIAGAVQSRTVTHKQCPSSKPQPTQFGP
jgi:hypothetical protein